LAKRKIIITGGPSTGKTTIISKLQEKGYYCFPEFIRSITKELREDNNKITFISNPIVSVAKHVRITYMMKFFYSRPGKIFMYQIMNGMKASKKRNKFIITYQKPTLHLDIIISKYLWTR